MRRKDGKCCRCPAQAKPNDSYCVDCARAKSRAEYLARKKSPPVNRNACNCGNARCNGMMCESLRHGSAA